MGIQKDQRDTWGGLICPHLGCKHVIRAMTGLQEIQKLQAHFRKKHSKNININEALQIRHFVGA